MISVAVMPALALLILSRTVAKLVSPLPMLMVTALLPALRLNPAAGVPARYWPRSMVSVPSLSVLVDAGSAPLMRVWPCARRVTATA